MTTRISYLVVCPDLRIIYYGTFEKPVGEDIRNLIKKLLRERYRKLGVMPLVIGESRTVNRPDKAIIIAEDRLRNPPGTYAGFSTEVVDL